MIDQEYEEHSIFKEIKYYSNFHKILSYSIFCFITSGTRLLSNFDSYIFSSIEGNLESIHDTLFRGRINDSYALLRKYHDSIVINIYSMLYLQDNLNIENIVVENINNWINGKVKLPEFRIMSEYIKKSDRLKNINNLLYKDNTFKEIRNRCNDHMHYNSFKNLIVNDKNLFLKNRIQILDTFSKDIENLFILHFCYIFYLNDQYLLASDYIDYLDMGLQPEEGMQYLVNPYLQEVFDKIIKKNSIELADEIKNNTAMLLE